MANTNETKFYQSLENIFTGANIEGEGGYINLLKIKSAYYKQILKNFKKEILKNTMITGEFKEEFFDRLYSFFEKYFSESGSVYFVKTANWQKVYEKVYTDNKDVVLFWKTNMLYYVKSDILFHNITIEVEDENNKKHSFYFDCGNLQNKQNNEKKELIFTYTKTEKNIYNFNVSYSKSGAKTNIETLSKQTKLPTEIIQKAFNIFKKQNTVDFFINKNAKKFLTEQLDLYLHQILLAEDNIFEQKRLTQLKTVKEFALKITNFISQFEDELVRIWNKPKFVLDSNYVITLDKLSAEIINKISKHKNLKEQIIEWQMLGMVDNNFSFNKRLEEHKHLPIDTKYFKDLELEILSLFDNLDEALDGRLINSENYQALNTLKYRYKEKIQCIYIDPPFNTGNDFDYIDDYQDSSWLSILYDRLDLSRDILNNEGSIFLHLDHFSEHRGRELLDFIFKKENFINNLSWAYRSGGASDSKTLPYKHDSILFYSKNKDKFKLHPIYERQYYIKDFMGSKKDKDGNYYSDTLLRDIFEGEFLDPTTNIKYNVRKVLNLSNEFYSFKNSQKPEGLIHVLLNLNTNNDKNIILDFFAGSGTTIAVAKKIGKKFIGVEMGNHFDNFYVDEIEYKNSQANKIDIYKRFNVIDIQEEDKKLKATVNKVGLLGRMKEVIANNGKHEPCGISKNINWQGGGFFKYYKLEQYENTLDKVNYNEKTPQIIFDFKRPFENYIFQTDAKLSDVLKVKDNIADVNFDNLYKNIDFAETISLIKGKAIKRITKTGVLLENEKEEIKTDYKNMTNEEKIEFIKLLKPLLWWGK